jgi:signal transduction histidine kinase
MRPDAEQLFSVLKNVIGNSITLKNYVLEEPAVFIRITCSPGEVAIVIDDNGVGFAEENLDAVFRKFIKSSVQSAGSGLCIYIVKQTVKRLGARFPCNPRKVKAAGVGTNPKPAWIE